MGATVALISLAAACSPGDGYGNMFDGTKPTDGVAATLPRPAPDSRGVISYNSYQVMVAGPSDTIGDMAQRVGLAPEELARHNGLPVSYRPRQGEVMALPRNVGAASDGSATNGGATNGGATTGSAPIWSTDIAASAISSAPLGAASASGQTRPTTTVAQADTNPFANGQPSPVIDPVRHRVEPGETAFSISRLYGVSVDSLSEWNGLDQQKTVRLDQELLIPVVNGANATPRATRVAAINAPGTASAIAPPPSAAMPLPPNQSVTDVVVPPSPNLAAVEPVAPAPTPVERGGALLMPVQGATVLRPYAPSGAARNEGVDLAVAAGSPVLAAESGEIALISESIGGLGTIVLVRHADNLMTVYGRVSGVTFNKGDTVSRGQQIGVVAPADTPNLHFEVRRGTAAVDPGPYLNL